VEEKDAAMALLDEEAARRETADAEMVATTRTLAEVEERLVVSADVMMAAATTAALMGVS
jgi:hypothetical protein